LDLHCNIKNGFIAYQWSAGVEQSFSLNLKYLQEYANQIHTGNIVESPIVLYSWPPPTCERIQWHAPPSFWPTQLPPPNPFWLGLCGLVSVFCSLHWAEWRDSHN
jgi:hypothetical protein